MGKHCFQRDISNAITLRFLSQLFYYTNKEIKYFLFIRWWTVAVIYLYFKNRMLSGNYWISEVMQKQREGVQRRE